jgi:hypothetical protein
MARLRRFSLILALAFSFGGFTFYAGVVVPIGGAAFGAAVQGRVTRQVTHVLNAATAVTVLLLAWDAAAGRAGRSRGATATLIACTSLVALCCVALVALHSPLESLMDAAAGSEIDHQRFYAPHRIYLWVSALQWLCMFPILWVVADRGQDRFVG